MSVGMAIPKCFCWSRFGTEAGETIEQILERKEVERSKNNGLFLWGIGNSIGPSLGDLLSCEKFPEVLFSPIISAPKRVDILPTTTCVWTSAKDLNGKSFSMPQWSRVTSRVSTGPKANRHYALVCFSDIPLRIDTNPPFIRMNRIRNLRTNNVVGASQVTSVVRYSEDLEENGTRYSVAFRERLVAPFFVVLGSPVIL